MVILQFGLLLVLAWMSVPRALKGDWSIFSTVLVGLSVAVGVWTLLHNRLGNFNIHPAPKANAELVTSGPYHFVRHPMYTAVLLGGAAMADLSGSTWGWLVWAALMAVLWSKASLEESWLRDQYTAYADYCLVRKRFIPWLF